MVSFYFVQHKMVSAALLGEKSDKSMPYSFWQEALRICKFVLRIAGGWAHQLSATASVYALNNSHVPGQ